MSLLLALNQVATGVAMSSPPIDPEVEATPKVVSPNGRVISDRVIKRRQLILQALKEAGPSGLTRRDLETQIPEIYGNSHWYMKELLAMKAVVQVPQEGAIQRRPVVYALPQQESAQ